MATLKAVTGPKKSVWPQAAAGKTLIGTGPNPNGYAIAYGADGKPTNFVKLPKSKGSVGSSGIAPGWSVKYDAAGKPSLVKIGAGGVSAVARGTAASASPSAVRPPDLSLPDDIFTQQNLGIQRRYGTDLSDITQQENASALDYGINIRRDPTSGRISGYDDPFSNPAQLASNPFSRAAALQKSYQTSQKVDSGALSARGQGYSGAADAAARVNTEGYEGNKDALFKAFQNLSAGYNSARDTAFDTADESGLESLQALRDRNAAIPVADQPGALTPAKKDYTDSKVFTNSKGTRGFNRTHTNGRVVFVKV